MQCLHERIATRHRHRHEIGLELHLTRERALRDHEQMEDGIGQQADRPNGQPHRPAEGKNEQPDGI
jgi:hypothetical protein